MENRVLDVVGEADKRQFKQLAAELRQLVPYRDQRGRLQFRILKRGEKPLNRWARRHIAWRLVSGDLKEIRRQP